MRLMQDIFLEMMDFRMIISEEEYQGMNSRVKSMIASKFASRG